MGRFDQDGDGRRCDVRRHVELLPLLRGTQHDADHLGRGRGHLGRRSL